MADVSQENTSAKEKMEIAFKSSVFIMFSVHMHEMKR